MKQTLDPKYLYALFGVVVLLMLLTGLTQNGFFVSFALCLLILGWGLFLIFGYIDSYKNRQFDKLRQKLEKECFLFLGPKDITNVPGGQKAKIGNDRFCTAFGNDVRCFKASSAIINLYGISYRELEGADNAEYILAYDPLSEKFGLFQRNLH